MTTTAPTKADRILARIDAGLGGSPIHHRAHTADERRAIIADAERAIDKTFGTDMQELVADWFLGLLAELEVRS